MCLLIYFTLVNTTPIKIVKRLVDRYDLWEIMKDERNICMKLFY